AVPCRAEPGRIDGFFETEALTGASFSPILAAVHDPRPRPRPRRAYLMVWPLGPPPGSDLPLPDVPERPRPPPPAPRRPRHRAHGHALLQPLARAALRDRAAPR